MGWLGLSAPPMDHRFHLKKPSAHADAARPGLLRSMQPPPPGSILDGLHRPSGLNVLRSATIAARSSGEKSLGMNSIFSTPMPCSPVTLPPTRDALVENLVARQQDALHLVGVALVEEQDRVDVAVAGVEDVGDRGDCAAGRPRRCDRRMCGSLVRGTTPSWVQ